jgi:hypothetical protein
VLYCSIALLLYCSLLFFLLISLSLLSCDMEHTHTFIFIFLSLLSCDVEHTQIRTHSHSYSLTPLIPANLPMCLCLHWYLSPTHRTRSFLGSSLLNASLASHSSSLCASREPSHPASSSADRSGTERRKDSSSTHSSPAPQDDPTSFAAFFQSSAASRHLRRLEALDDQLTAGVQTAHQKLSKQKKLALLSVLQTIDRIFVAEGDESDETSDEDEASRLVGLCGVLWPARCTCVHDDGDVCVCVCV